MHPLALVFHLIFRVSAIIFYAISTWFVSSFVTSICILFVLIALDFWFTKNVTGRLLAGLRWWNYVDESGNSFWVFESRRDPSENSKFESTFFWWSLCGTEIIWMLYLLASILTFSFLWLPVVIVALVLNGTNIYGYMRCRWNSSESDPLGTMTSAVGLHMLKSGFSSMWNRARPGSSSAAASSSVSQAIPSGPPPPYTPAAQPTDPHGFVATTASNIV